MTINISFSRMALTRLIREVGRLRADQRGAVAIVMGFLLPVAIGMFGLGVEVSTWYLKTRQMQNAADAAALAAASNDSSNYATEANAVAAFYNLVNGVNNVQTQPAKVTNATDVRCPATLNGLPNPSCYRMTINWTVPLYLAQVVGYTGNNNGNGTELLTRTALAVPQTFQQPICLLGLDPTLQAITSNGGPNTDFTGCTVMSNSNGTCNGSDLEATFGLAHGTNNGCGNVGYSGIPQIPDPYLSMASNIPTDLPTKCGNSYPQEKKIAGNWTFNPPAPLNQWSGGKTLTATYDSPVVGNNLICGDLQLTGNVTITDNVPGGGAVLYIMNGMLDTQGHTFQTASGSSVTLVFTGTNGGSYSHFPGDRSGGSNGVLNFEAPKTGPFSGIAIYQDPALTSGVDFTYTGNSPTWDITGGVYAPNAHITVSGVVNQSSNGANCFVMVADRVTINGTGQFYAQSPNGAGCKQAGLNMPMANIPGKSKLVY
jgi:Flp pilus assembly protein TadG